MAKKWLLRLAPLALLFGAQVAFAQNASSITGVVTDGATGKPVEGAVIVLSNPAAQVEQTVVSEAGGKYTVPDLPPGDYKLAVQLDGYKPFERADLKLKEATTLRANAALTPEGVQLEEVVVTGSRIRRKDLTTPAPVTVVNAEQIQAAGKISVGDFLQALPEQGNSVNNQVNNGNDGSIRVSLRSLGDNRTLVLVNGRRMVAGGTEPGVGPDLNTIPAAAIERIEVLKDGASAVYGSDAIAGVVNIILKKKYNGMEVAAYSGTSSRRDGTTYDVSAAMGTAGEKSSMLLTLGYQEQKAIFAGDRDWAKTTYAYDFTDGSRPPSGNSTTFPAGRFSIPSAATTCAHPATIANPALRNLCEQYQDTGVTSYVPDGNGGWTPYDGSYYNTNPTNYLVVPNRRFQLFSTGDTKLGDVARAFYEASYVNRKSASNLAPMPFVNNSVPTAVVSISKDSAYNPFGVNVTSWRKRLTEFGNRSWTRDLDTFRTVVGLDGTLGDWAGPLKGWSWETSYNFGRTGGTEVSGGQLVMSRVAQSVGASKVVNGKAVCLDAGGKVIPGCVPIDVLHGEGNIATEGHSVDELRNWLTFDGTVRSYNQQEVFSASTSGELFKLKSDRPVGLAVGVDFRRESGGYLPDPITASSDSSGNNQKPTEGKYDVTEGFAELSVPVVSNVPWAYDLELSGAFRAFRYSTFGSDSTYKLGAMYSPVRDLTVRGTYSTAFRAPNVGELYGGAADSYEYATDPQGLDNASQFLTHWLGNPDLKPETAKIFTMGLVLEPRWVKNLAITFDYYKIKLDKAIGLHGTQWLLDKCYKDPSPAGQAYCQFIHRDAEGQINFVEDQRGNLTKTATSGIDFAGHYVLPTPSYGRFTFVLDGTYLLQYDETDLDGVTIKYAGTYDGHLSMPRWKINSGVSWDLKGFGAGIQTRFVSSYKECSSGLCANDSSEARQISAYLPFDLSGSYQLTSAFGKTTLSAGVVNVLDAKPPFIATASNFNSDPSTYDYIGRYYYVRLSQSF